MERNKMLKLLSEQHTAAKLIVLSSEMAIECTYVSNKGFKYEWIPLDQWPAGIVTFANRDIFHNITKRIVDQTLEVNDIRGTSLWSIYKDWFEETGDVKNIFAGMANLRYPESGKVYLLRTAEDTEFFNEYGLFENRFFDEFVSDCTPWDSLSDDELEEWVDRTRNEFDGIPCSEYEE